MITRSMASRVTLVLVVAVLAIAGCSKNQGKRATPIRNPSPSSSSDSRTQAEREALAAYTGMWAAMAKAGQTANPDEPELRRYATGDALALLVGTLVGYRDRGLVTRGQPTTTPRVTALTPQSAPTEASVVDCGDSTGWTTHNAKTGEQIKDDPRGRRRITASVKVVDAIWKVANVEIGEIGSC
jgi:hypothetical protein